MYFLIVGADAIGERLTESLIISGHEVFVIDLSHHKVANLQSRLGRLAKQGDGTNYSVMKDAGANRADAVLVTTSDDAVNLAVCQMAKSAFGVTQTMALVNEHENVRIFQEGGVDAVVSSTDLVFAHLSSLLPALPPLHLMPVKNGEKEVINIKIPSGSVADGTPIADISLPPECRLLAAISSEGEPLSLSGERTLQPDENLLILTPSDIPETAWETLTEAR